VTRPIPAAELAARVQSVLEIPLHRFLGIALADAGRPAAGIVLPSRARRSTTPTSCTAGS